MSAFLMWRNPFVPDAKILIENRVLKIIDKHRQNSFEKPEAGGILLGYRRDNHLHVIDATVPQPSDQRSLFRFFRKDRRHQEVATKYWLTSGETIDYIGEWHTHPEEVPTPSGLDHSEWRKICQARSNSMIFLIAGIRHNIWLGVGTEKGTCKAQLEVNKS